MNERVYFATNRRIDRKGARRRHPQHHRKLCSSIFHTPYSTSQSHRSYIVSTHPQDVGTSYKVSDLSCCQPILVSPNASPLSISSSSLSGSPASSTPPQLLGQSHHAFAFVYARICIVWNKLSLRPIPVPQSNISKKRNRKNVKKKTFLLFCIVKL